jgi:XTP/dITP diphosphohydrolase
VTALPDEWVLASGNPGKLREFHELFGRLAKRLRAQSEFGLAPPAEVGSSFVENALSKARHASRATGLPSIADDSGLCVRILGGRPGIHSARFAGGAATDAENIEALLEALESVAEPARDAYFYCVIVALCRADDPAPWIASGRWDGRIARAPAGTRGFGYDPVFIPEGGSVTAAEMPAAEKNRLSHRAKALDALARQWRSAPP